MLSILAVDDSPSMRKMVSFTLTGAGYQVVEAVVTPSTAVTSRKAVSA